MASTTVPILPISEISAYRTGWTIKARVTTRGQLRTWSKSPTNTGKVFNVDLLDSFGGEIRANFFNAAVDQFEDKLQVGKVFTFSRGSVKIADKRFSTTSHRYEIVFDKDAQVVEVANDEEIGAMKFSFVELQALSSKPLPCRLDVCGVVTSFKQTFSLQSKDGRALVKREITIADDSATSMEVTLWDDYAKKPDADFEGNPLVGLKGVSIKEYNGGRSGSLGSSGGIVFEPPAPEAQRVKQWWSQGGATQTLTALSVTGGGGGGGARANAKLMTIADMRRAAETVGDKPEHFSMICRLSLVSTKKQGEPQPLTYMACLEPPKTEDNRPSFATCNRRVDESGFCASCNRVTKAGPRMMLRCKYSDFEDSTWMTTFHEPAEQVLGMKAEEIQVLEREAQQRGEGGREKFELAIRQKFFTKPLQVTARAKLETYQGVQRTNISCVDARPVNVRETGRKLLTEIREMLVATATMTAASGA